MQDLLNAVKDLGFPIAIAAYMLIRIESKLDSLSSSINQLATIISAKLVGDNGNKSA